MTRLFAVLGPYGVGNIGDAAIVDAMLKNILKYCPGSVIYGININPDDTFMRHSIHSFPLHRNYKKNSDKEGTKEVSERLSNNPTKQLIKKIPFLFVFLKTAYGLLNSVRLIFLEAGFIIRSYQNIKNFDILIVNGSGQLCDTWGGPWWHPYGLFRWGVIARAASVKFVVMSVGAGPLNSSLSRFFAKHAMKMASYRSFRNEDSKELVERIGVKGKNLVVPDIAFSLPVVISREGNTDRNNRPVVGVNPMAYCDPRTWPESDSEKYATYIGKLSSVVTWLLEKDYKVLLFSSDSMDKNVIKDVRQLVDEKGYKYEQNQISEAEIWSVTDLLSNISKMEMVIGTRLHSLLLSALMFKPLLALSPHPKVDSLMAGLGLSEYSFDINGFHLEAFQEKFVLLEGKREKVSEQIKNCIVDYQNKLDKQYQQVFCNHL